MIAAACGEFGSINIKISSFDAGDCSRVEIRTYQNIPIPSTADTSLPGLTGNNILSWGNALILVPASRYKTRVAMP